MEKVNNSDENVLEGVALQYGTGYDIDYAFPCPVCGTDVETDDFDTAYRCDKCKSVVRFDEKDIRIAGEQS